jgi:hypothetical protein
MPAPEDPSLEAQHMALRPIHAVCETGGVKVRRLAGRPVRAKVQPTFDSVTSILQETLGPERGAEIVGAIAKAFEGWQEKVEGVGA